jgi:hypothetical protein
MSSRKEKKTSLFKIFFDIQINIKTFHWLTKSYGKHIATDKLYENISEKIDKFIEVYIGKYNRPIITNENVTFKYMNDVEFIKYLKYIIIFLEKDLLNYISLKDNDLLNIRDEMVAEINQTIYLFTLE